IGVVLGKGTNWEWGANQTTEAVVVKNGHVLFVKRGDTGQWSLPGGYVNQGELPAAAAMREVAEESGLADGNVARTTQVYQGPVADIRATANAWQETSTFLVELED